MNDGMVSFNQRPVGLLSSLTNMRPPEHAEGRETRSNRNPGSQIGEERIDVQSNSSLVLSRQTNEADSLSPSPAHRLRYMNVQGMGGILGGNSH